MILYVADGSKVDRLTKGSHKKVLIKCDWDRCSEVWETEYRYWHGKDKHYCKRHRATGKRHSFKTREKLSMINLGEKNPNYKNGSRSIYQAGRENIYYREWHSRIRERADGYCEICGEIGEETHHHVIPYKEIVTLVISGMHEYELETRPNGYIGLQIGRYHLENDVPGMWLCKRCHWGRHSKDGLDDEPQEVA